MKKLILIDGMAAVYRGYYAMNSNPRINSKGMNTSATLGFTMGLYDLLRSQRPTHIGVAFDLPKPTFRHEMYADYKAHRDPMPEEIESNMPWICRVIEGFRIPRLTCEGFEADDVIGTLSHAAELAGFDEVVMVTPDKDFAQLVTPKVKMFRQGRGKTPDAMLGVGEVCEKYDVANCRQVIDLLGLWGDAIDNIPGIPGVGEKTAKKLIAQFGSIENMIEHADEIKNDRIREKVREHAEQALFSKQLATIRLDAPIDFNEDNLLRQKPDYASLREIFDQLEFRQLARRIFTDLSVSDPEEAAKWQGQTSATSSASLSSSTSNTSNTSHTSNTSTPTLFDMLPTEQETPEVPHNRLSPDILRTLKGKDLAVGVEAQKIAIAIGADNVWEATFDTVDTNLLKELLTDTTSIKLCFDLKALKYSLARHGLTIDGDIFDAQLAHYLLDAEMRHTADNACSNLLGFVPADMAALTAALWQLYPLMTARMRDAGLEPLYHDVELPLVDVLMDMEREGVRIDTAALTDYSRQLSAELAGIEQKIYDMAGMRFNIGSPKQLGEVLYERLKVTDKPPRTATKQYSTAEEVLQKLAAKHPVIPLILEYRSITKLIGTYLDAFPKLINPETKRLHTVYNQTVTATGRLSSSNPNLQNIPIRTERGREIRRAFVARDEEYLLLAADYSQIELRIIASLAKDRHLLEAFAAGYDIHAATAAKIYHIGIDEVSKEQRRNAKSVNFGIVYGISAFGLSEQLDIPRKESQALIDEYFNQYPDIKEFIEKSKEFARKHGYARTLLGRRRYLPDINSRNASARSFAERNAVNMPIQGTSADMIKLAMVRIHNELQSRKLRSRMILQVHDELVFDLYRPEEQEMRQLVEHEMKNALPLEGIDIEVGIDIGDNWLQAH